MLLPLVPAQDEWFFVVMLLAAVTQWIECRTSNTEAVCSSQTGSTIYCRSSIGQSKALIKRRLPVQVGPTVPYTAVAQLAEQRTLNARVARSSRVGGTIYLGVAQFGQRAAPGTLTPRPFAAAAQGWSTALLMRGLPVQVRSAAPEVCSRRDSLWRLGESLRQPSHLRK